MVFTLGREEIGEERCDDDEYETNNDAGADGGGKEGKSLDVLAFMGFGDVHGRGGWGFALARLPWRAFFGKKVGDGRLGWRFGSCWWRGLRGGFGSATGWVVVCVIYFVICVIVCIEPVL